MPANRRRSAITAPYDRWALLGSRLELRRRELGHTWRTTFEAASGVNKRLAADVEKAAKARVNTFMPGTLQLVAHGYAVTHESVLALLRGERDDLVPAPGVPAGPGELIPAVPDRLMDGPDGWQPPIADPVRRAADAPYAAPILDRLLELADAGVIDPDGAQMFPGAPDDAKSWDGHGAWVRAPRDRAWFIADIRRLEAGRAGNSGTGAAGA
jgi:hypothetical protein